VVAAAARRDGLIAEAPAGLGAPWLVLGEQPPVLLKAGPEYCALFRFPDGRERRGGYFVSED
jgi:hypothetical protein